MIKSKQYRQIRDEFLSYIENKQKLEMYETTMRDGDLVGQNVFRISVKELVEGKVFEINGNHGGLTATVVKKSYDKIMIRYGEREITMRPGGSYDLYNTKRGDYEYYYEVQFTQSIRLDSHLEFEELLLVDMVIKDIEANDSDENRDDRIFYHQKKICDAARALGRFAYKFELMEDPSYQQALTILRDNFFEPYEGNKISGLKDLLKELNDAAKSKENHEALIDQDAPDYPVMIPVGLFYRLVQDTWEDIKSEELKEIARDIWYKLYPDTDSMVGCKNELRKIIIRLDDYAEKYQMTANEDYNMVIKAFEDDEIGPGYNIKDPTHFGVLMLFVFETFDNLEAEIDKSAYNKPSVSAETELRIAAFLHKKKFKNLELHESMMSDEHSRTLPYEELSEGQEFSIQTSHGRVSGTVIRKSEDELVLNIDGQEFSFVPGEWHGMTDHYEIVEYNDFDEYYGYSLGFTITEEYLVNKYIAFVYDLLEKEVSTAEEKEHLLNEIAFALELYRHIEADPFLIDSKRRKLILRRNEITNGN